MLEAFKIIFLQSTSDSGKNLNDLSQTLKAITIINNSLPLYSVYDIHATINIFFFQQKGKVGPKGTNGRKEWLVNLTESSADLTTNVS